METQHPPFQIKSHMIKGFYGVRDKNLFNTAIQTAVNQLNTGGVYIGDNMFVFSRNLGFLRDEKFMQIFQDNVTTGNEQAARWRYYTLSWAAKRVLSLNIPGDFVECACYRGTSARILCDYLDFGASGRDY
jgi:O-methyltransferase